MNTPKNPDSNQNQNRQADADRSPAEASPAGSNTTHPTGSDPRKASHEVPGDEAAIVDKASKSANEASADDAELASSNSSVNQEERAAQTPKTLPVRKKMVSTGGDNRPIFSPLAVNSSIETRDKGSAESFKPLFSRWKQQRTVNYRFLFVLIVLIVALTGTAWGIHSLQVRRLSSSLLDQQRRAEKSGDMKLAARYLGQYLGYEPDDVERHAELAELLQKTADNPRERFRALQYMEKVIRMDPLQNKIRRMLADELIAFARFPDALVHLEALLAQFPDDGELEYKSGLCHHAQEKFQKASIAYRSAIDHAPDHLESYYNLAIIMRDQFQQADEARKLIDDMVAKNPHLAEAFAGRARYLIESRDFKGAASDVATAHRIDPKDIDILALALLLIEKNIEMPTLSKAEVRDQLERLVKESPQEPRLYLALSQMAESDRQEEQAVEWLTKGLQAMPENTDIAMQLTGIWVRQGQLEQARTQIENLKSNRDTEKAAVYLEAQLLLRQQEWLQARMLLQDLLKRLPPDVPLAISTQLSIAQCARALRDPDTEITAYRHVLEYRPDLNEVRQLLAEALASAGKKTEAMAYYDAQVEDPDKPLVMARALIQNTLKLPPEQQRWDEVENVLNNVRKSLPDQVEPIVLLSQVRERQGDIEGARALLEEGKQQFADSPIPWIGLVELEARRKDLDAARQRLDEARAKLGDRVQFRVTDLMLLLATDREQVVPALETLQRELNQYTQREQSELLLRMAGIYQVLGQPEQAIKLYEDLISRNPGNLNVHLAFLEIAIQTENIAAAQREIARLKRIEGENGPHMRLGQAAITAIRVFHKELPVDHLKSVRSQLDQLKKDRPNWSQVWLLQARVEEMTGDFPAALKAYREAVDHGLSIPGVYLRLIQLLVAQGEDAEADTVIREYLEHAEWSRNSLFYRMASEVAHRLKDKPRAVDYARKAAELQPDNARAQMWLASLLDSSAPSSDELEETLRKAIDVERKQPLPWLSLIRFLVKADRMLDAEQALQEASTEIEEESIPLFMANGCEILGRPDEAEQHYLTALSLKSDDPKIIAIVADYYVRINQLEKAEPLLSRILREETQAEQPLAVDARRKLALVYAQRNHAGLLQGLALIDENAEGGELSREDQLLKARLLSQYPRPAHRREALRIFRQLESNNPLSVDDELRLTQLLVDPDSRDEAKRRWKKLVADHSERGNLLIAAARYFMLNDQLSDARKALDKLQAVMPDTPISVELLAELDAREGHVDRTLAHYQKFVESEKDESQKINKNLLAAAMAVRLARPQVIDTLDEDARGKLLEYALGTYQAIARNKPEAELGIAEVETMRKNFDAAIDIYQNVLATSQASAAIPRLIQLHRAESLTDEQRDRVANLIDSRFATHASPELRWQLAAWHDQREENAKAVEIYRELLVEEPSSIIAMNNLAWLLAMDGEQLEEARKLIEQALLIAGPIPDLLDTQGVILIRAGEYQQAITSLQAAIEEGDSAVRRFHLAQAFAGNKDRDAARFHLKEAERMKLNERSLDDREISSYQSLKSELGQN